MGQMSIPNSGIEPPLMKAWRNNSPAMAAALFCALAWPGLAAPARLRQKIDFDRDVRPILETSCLRCHGPEKPKSHFRLDDRALALKGGNDGVDIVPGNAAASPLIRYVSGADKEIQMPPPGKGAPLTTNQIALLRRWIDEGAPWSQAKPQPAWNVEVAPEFQAIGVHGDVGKFQELEGLKAGYTVGADHFSFDDQVNAQDKVSVEGRYLSGGQDLELKLAMKRADVGFIDAGFEQWRKYYDNFGGYDAAVSPPGAAAAGALELDEGHFWINFGLTLPNWPEIVLGFDEQSRVGNESTLQWGAIGGKNIGSATAAINEHTDTIKLDITKDLAGWHLEDSARFSIYHQNDGDNNPDGGLVTMTSVQVQDDYHQTQGMNTLRAEKSVTDWWSISTGYYYSRLTSSDAVTETTYPACDITPVGYYWHTPQVTESTDSQIFSVSSIFRLARQLNFTVESQNEWTRELGFGTVYLDFGSPPTVPTPMVENANLDTLKTLQNFSLRYTAIPYTILSAEARFEEDSISEFQQDSGNFTDDAFYRKTDADNTTEDIHGGFDTSPWRWFGLNAQFRYYSSDTEYNQLLDSTPLSGYPAFILGRTIKTDQGDVKMIFKPSPWLRTTVNYQIVRTGYSSLTDPVSAGISPGGPLMTGLYDARTYAIGTTLVPARRVSFTGSFSYSDSRTTTFDNSDPSVVAYKGNVYLISASATYNVNKTTDVSANYSYGRASYGQNDAVAGVPLGLDYMSHRAVISLRKRFNPHLTGSVQYAYYNYVEPSAANLTDYNAQGIFATLGFQW